MLSEVVFDNGARARVASRPPQAGGTLEGAFRSNVPWGVPGGYPGKGTRQGALGVFSGYPGRYPGEIPGWPGEYPEVRLPRPRGSIGASNPNATVSNYQITNIEKASSRAWCIAAIFVPLFYFLAFALLS